MANVSHMKERGERATSPTHRRLVFDGNLVSPTILAGHGITNSCKIYSQVH